MSEYWVIFFAIAATGALGFIIGHVVAQRRLRQLSVEVAGLRDEIRRASAVEDYEPLDLTPLTTTMELLQIRLATMDSRLTTAIRGVAEKGRLAASRSTRNGAMPRVLSTELYGAKDDLKMIDGVGPTIERLLNANGVYYFWQIAEWDQADIDAIDKRLLSFRGRISRDDWVSQARELIREEESRKLARAFDFRSGNDSRRFPRQWQEGAGK